MTATVANLPEALRDVLAGSSFSIALDGSTIVPPAPGSHSWDTRGYSDFESVLKGDFVAPQAEPSWLQTERKVDWDPHTGHRRRRAAPAWLGISPDFEPAALADRTKSSSSTSDPISQGTTTVPPTSSPISPVTLARRNVLSKSSRDSSPEVSASSLHDAESNSSDHVPLGNTQVGPPGSLGKLGVLRPTNLKPGEYRPARRELSPQPMRIQGAYRSALANGIRQDPTLVDRTETAHLICDSANRALKIIEDATYVDPHPADPSKNPSKAEEQAHPILNYTEAEKAERLEVRERLREEFKGMQKRRQKQEYELKRIESRFVTHARHASALTAIAAGGQDEELGERHWQYQMKHSHYAALAALGAHQISRFKIFHAFQGRLDLEQKRVRMHQQKHKLKGIDDSATDSDGMDWESLTAIEQAKLKEYRRLQTEFQIAREKHKEIETRRKTNFQENMAQIGNRERGDGLSPMTKEKASDVEKRLQKRAMEMQQDEKVAKNFSKLLEFINNGQASMRKLLSEANKIEKKEKEARKRLEEEVEDECVEQVNKMVKTGNVPKAMLEKVRQQELVSVVGSNEIMKLQRERKNLIAIQTALQAKIEHTAVKQAKDMASAKAYQEAVKAGLSMEEANDHAAKAAALTTERAKEALHSEEMQKVLRPVDDSCENDSQATTDDLAQKAMELTLAAAHDVEELNNGQSELQPPAPEIRQGSKRADALKATELATETEATTEARAAAGDRSLRLSKSSVLSERGRRHVEDMLPQLQDLAKQAEEVVSEIVGGVRAANTGCDEQLLKQLEDSLGVLTTAVGHIAQHEAQGQDSSGKSEAKMPLPEDIVSRLQAGFANWSNIGSQVGCQLQAIQEPLQSPEPEENTQSQQDGVDPAMHEIDKEAAERIEERIKTNLEEAARVEAANAILHARVEELRKQFAELEAGAESGDTAVSPKAVKRTNRLADAKGARGDAVSPAEEVENMTAEEVQIAAKEELKEARKETKQLNSTLKKLEKELAIAEKRVATADAKKKPYQVLDAVSEKGPTITKGVSSVSLQSAVDSVHQSELDEENGPVIREESMHSLRQALGGRSISTMGTLDSLDTLDSQDLRTEGEILLAAPSGLKGLDLFKHAAKTIIQQNSDEKQASIGMEDISAEKREFICKRSGYSERDLLKEKTRVVLRLQLQRQIKKHKHEIKKRTKILIKFLSPEEVASMQKAGLISAQGKPGVKPMEEGGFEAEEKRLKQRLQMLVNLINFWSRRLEQAGLFEDDSDILPQHWQQQWPQQWAMDPQSPYHQGAYDGYYHSEDSYHDYVDPNYVSQYGYQGLENYAQSGKMSPGGKGSMYPGKSGMGFQKGLGVGGKMGYGKGDDLFGGKMGYGKGDDFFGPGYGRQVGGHAYNMMTPAQKGQMWHDSVHYDGVDAVYSQGMDPRSYQGHAYGWKGGGKGQQHHMNKGAVFFEKDGLMDPEGKSSLRHKIGHNPHQIHHFFHHLVPHQGKGWTIDRPGARGIKGDDFNSGLGIMGAKVGVNSTGIGGPGINVLMAHSLHAAPRDISGLMVHGQKDLGKLYRSNLGHALHKRASANVGDRPDLRGKSPQSAQGAELTLGGPSSEQVSVADRFVREILATAKLPLNKDSMLSSICLWLEEPERKAVIAHLWRVFSRPEPVQRAALKALANGKVGENSPLKRFRKKGVNGMNKLLGIASAIARRLWVLIEHMHHHQSEHGSTWTGKPREDMHQKDAYHIASALGGTQNNFLNVPGQAGLRRGNPRSSLLPDSQRASLLFENNKRSSCMLRPDLSDLIRAHGGQPLSDAELKALAANSRPQNGGGRRASMGRRMSLTNPDVMREKVQEAAQGVQARLARAASLAVQTRQELDEQEDAAEKAQAAWEKMKRSVRQKAIIQSLLGRKLQAFPVNDDAVSSPRARTSSDRSTLCIDVTDHLKRMASKERQALSYLYKENGKASRSLSQPSLFSAANSPPSPLFQAGQGARTSWKRRGSVSGPWTDDLTEQWKQITMQVRQEKEEIYREYKDRQTRFGVEDGIDVKAKGDRRTSSAKSRSPGKATKKSLDLEQLREEDDDDEDLGGKPKVAALKQDDLLKMRNEAKEAGDDANAPKGNIQQQNWAILKSVSKFKRAAHKRQGYDDGLIHSDIQAKARLKSIRHKKQTLLDDSDVKAPTRNRLDFIWGMPNDMKESKENSENSSSSYSSGSEEYVDESLQEEGEKRKASLLKGGLGALGWKKVKVVANAASFARRAAIMQEEVDKVGEVVEKVESEKAEDPSPASAKNNALLLFEESTGEATSPGGRSRSPAPPGWSERGQKNWVQAMQTLKGTSKRRSPEDAKGSRSPTRRLVNTVHDDEPSQHIGIRKTSENEDDEKQQAMASPRGVRRRGPLVGKTKGPLGKTMGIERLSMGLAVDSPRKSPKPQEVVNQESKLGKLEAISLNHGRSHSEDEAEKMSKPKRSSGLGKRSVDLGTSTSAPALLTHSSQLQVSSSPRQSLVVLGSPPQSRAQSPALPTGAQSPERAASKPPSRAPSRQASPQPSPHLDLHIGVSKGEEKVETSAPPSRKPSKSPQPRQPSKKVVAEGWGVDPVSIAKRVADMPVAKIAAPKQEPVESLAPKKGVLDPQSLVGLPIEVIHAEICNNLMLFKRKKPPQPEAKANENGDEAEKVAEVVEAAKPIAPVAHFANLPHMMRPSSWGKVTHAIASKYQSNPGQTKLVNGQTLESSEEKTAHPAPPNPMLLPASTTEQDFSLAFAPKTPRAPVEPPPPSYLKAAKHGAQLTPAMQILDRYLVDFACDDVEELIKGASQTAVQGVELPVLSPSVSPRRSRDFLSSNASPRRASLSKRMAEDPKLDHGRNLKLPSIDARTAGHVAATGLTAAEQRQLESVRKTLESRLQKIEACAARADEAERAERNRFSQRSRNHPGQSPRGPRGTPRRELLK